MSTTSLNMFVGFLPLNFFNLIFETGSHYVSQTDLYVTPNTDEAGFELIEFTCFGLASWD